MTRPEAPRPEDPGIALERLIGRVLRDQPLRRAPPTLETRVLARSEARARTASPHRSLAAWPRAARVGFVVAACVSTALVLIAWSWFASHFAATRPDPHVASWIAGLHTAASDLARAGELTTQIGRAVPRAWVYGGFLITTILYATLFGPVIVAYRMLGAAGAEREGIRR
jgi:hypothetical protein